MLSSWTIRNQFSVFVIITTFIITETSYGYSPCQRIDAAVRWASNNRTHFFSVDEYILYNDVHSAEEDVFDVSQIADSFPSNLDAAVNWFGRRKSFYFKGCYYYKFHEVRKRVQRRRLSRLGLPCDVDAALNTDGHHVLVFKGCNYWTILRRNRRAILAGTTNDLGLPCDVDAALTWENGTNYVIKDDVVWSLTSSNTAEYRTSLEEWNLCSWRVCENNGTNTNNSNQQQLADDFPCNGDERFCGLRFDQVTMAGSHNAGSGFDGGFGLLNCWVRNQVMTVLEQLRFGMRYLDVDTGWQQCGLLGARHNFLCGGPVCKMIKQIKRFLRENHHEVVAVNFNHEMTDHLRVLPVLVRQITSQLGHHVNLYYRNVGLWPSLGHAISSDKRLFVFIDKRIASELPATYFRHRWIHSEALLQRTWRGDVNVPGHCQEVIASSQEQCRRKQNAPLLEVSILGSSTSCVTSIADHCLPHVHHIARTCQNYRHSRGKAPNALLVDFPERTPHPAVSVVAVAFLQNVRNVARLSRAPCHVRVSAAVEWTGEDGEQKVLFFSGHRLAVYNWHLHTQDIRLSGTSAEELPATADAAFRRAADPSHSICFVRGCDVTCVNTTTSWHLHQTLTESLTAWGLPCHVQSAFTRNNNTYFLKGCNYWYRAPSGHVTGPQPLRNLGLPCDINAALQAPDGATYYFKEDNYWKYTDQRLSVMKDTLDWSADFLHC